VHRDQRIKDQMLRGRVVRKCLAQLLNDPCAGRMSGHVGVENVPPARGDDKGAYSTPKVSVGTVKKSMAAMASR
jgi:hypothetical protein